MLRKNGKIKKEYKHICGKVTEDLKELVVYLLNDQRLTMEETIGTITSATVLLVSQENTKRRIHGTNSKKKTT